MKNLLKVAFVAAGIFSFAQVKAETAVRDTTLGHKISRTAKKIGHKTSEVAAKGAAAVVDKKYEGKCAPGGQTVYINDKSHYYYVNKKGHRVYLKKSQLMNKPADKD